MRRSVTGTRIQNRQTVLYSGKTVDLSNSDVEARSDVEDAPFPATQRSARTDYGPVRNTTHIQQYYCTLDCTVDGLIFLNSARLAQSALTHSCSVDARSCDHEQPSLLLAPFCFLFDSRGCGVVDEWTKGDQGLPRLHSNLLAALFETESLSPILLFFLLFFLVAA